MMQTLRTATNRKGFYFWTDYERSDTDSVRSAYRTRPSIYKEQAEEDIKARMIEQGGYGYKILSHNGFTFTCGYLLDENTLIVDTKSNTYKVVYTGDYSK